TRSSLPAGNDGTRMAHSPARRRRLSADEADYWLLHVSFDVCRRFFFRRSSDLTNHDNGVGLRIFVEETNDIDEIRANDRVAADSDACRLPDFPLAQLAHRFIGQSSASRNDSDVTFEMNVTGHDSDLTAARRNDSRAVRPDKTRLWGF